MPHAESDANSMANKRANGTAMSSHFLEHLLSYPVVSDSITSFKENKYGAKSLEYADQGYDLVKPVFPYLSKPFGYVAPYLARADSLGYQGLTKIDSTFPIVKEDTEKIKGSIYHSVRLPMHLAGDAKQYLADVYGSEYKKCGGDGLVAKGKAVITTSLVLSQESLAWISSFLQAKTKAVVNEQNGE